MNKPKFLSNFWAGFSKVLGPGHVIRDLQKCDFTPIYNHLMAEREAKKGLAKEVRAWPGVWGLGFSTLIPNREP